jgi:nucleotide sugar dehydrogenase
MNSTMRFTKSVVIGGGRVGLPFALYLVDQQHDVIVIDIDQEYCDKLSTGLYVPFKEEGLEYRLFKAVKDNKIKFTTGYEAFTGGVVNQVFIFVGTPLNETELDTKNLMSVVNRLNGFNLKDTSIYIRSTVPIGTTRQVAEILNKEDVYFWPERVIEGNAFEEFDKLPNIIGGLKPANMDELFYGNKHLFIRNPHYVLAEEAEFIKIATNTARYIQFGISNEFMHLASDNGIDYNKIFYLMKKDYPRLAWLPAPGVNSGGPCLSKDWVAIDSGLAAHADAVNTDAMTDFVVRKVKQNVSDVKEICILGKTFKPESDDMRDSIYRLMYRDLARAFPGTKISSYDPYLDKDSFEVDPNVNVYIVLTPHKYIIDRVLPMIYSKSQPDVYVFNFWAAYTSSRSTIWKS